MSRRLLRDIVTMLPPGGDAAFVESELEQIRNLTLEALKAEHEQAYKREEFWRRFAADDLTELAPGLSEEIARAVAARARAGRKLQISRRLPCPPRTSVETVATH